MPIKENDYVLLLIRGARLKLNRPAITAIVSAIYRHASIDCSRLGMTAKIIVTTVAPNVCPVRRAVLCIPPAPPVRLIGVAMTMTILLGV